MNLKRIKSLGDGFCFACRFAGKDIAIWPQMPVEEPERIASDQYGFATWTSARWVVYTTVYEDVLYSGDQKMRSKERTITVCYDHWKMIEHKWIYLAWEEVWIDHLFYKNLEKEEQ